MKMLSSWWKLCSGFSGLREVDRSIADDCVLWENRMDESCGHIIQYRTIATQYVRERRADLLLLSQCIQRWPYWPVRRGQEAPRSWFMTLSNTWKRGCRHTRQRLTARHVLHLTWSYIKTFAGEVWNNCKSSLSRYQQLFSDVWLVSVAQRAL